MSSPDRVPATLDTVYDRLASANEARKKTGGKLKRFLAELEPRTVGDEMLLGALLAISSILALPPLFRMLISWTGI